MIWWMVAVAALLAALIAISAVRHPILARMALRNAGRRPRQTATVIAGLMVGTAIVSAALVAGDSAGYAVRGYVYQSLGHIDESVSITGYPYFSEKVYEELQDDPDVAAVTDGISAMAIWEATASDETGLFEPSVFVAGFDTQAPGFGRFDGHPPTDGADLRPGELIMTDHLAEELQMGVGDSVTLAFTRPMDPLVPEVTPLAGQFTDAGLPGIDRPAEARHVVQADPGATTVSVVFSSDAIGPVRVQIEDPSGLPRGQTEGVGTLWLNVTASPEDVLPAGDWTIVAGSDLAVQSNYQGVAVVAYPVYNLTRLQERARALQEEHGGLTDGLESLRAFGARHERTFVVAAISDGGRADTFDFRMGIWVGLADAQEMWGREGQVNNIAISNPGGIEGGVAGTHAALDALEASLDKIKARYPGVPAIQALQVEDEKRQFLAVADDAGELMTSLLVFAGSLSILTGLLLIVNIFTMLAEERRGDLGMARAVGLQRRDLVRMFLYEGALYAVAAAAIGAVLGLALAYGMIFVMNAIIAQIGADLSIPPVTFRPTFGAVGAAFGAGLILTFATIYGASRRQSRLNIVRAIRRIEEPERAGTWRIAWQVGAPMALVGAAALVAGWWPTGTIVGRFSMQVFGPLVLASGLGLMFRPVVRRRWLYPLLAGATALYYAGTIFIPPQLDMAAEANIVGPMRGVAMTLAVVVLLVYFERGTRALGWGLAGIKQLRAIAIPAVSYPLWRKFRTGMTLAMFAIVILSIGFFSIFGALFDTDPAKQTGGFDIEARTTLSVEDIDAFDRGLVPDVIDVRHDLLDYQTEQPDFITVDGGQTGHFGDFRHHVFGYDAAFAVDNGFRLLWRHDAYTTDQEAYEAVLGADDVVIVGYIYSTDENNRDLAYQVGDTLEMHLGDDAQSYTIIGIQEQFHYGAIWLPKDTVRGLFPTVDGLHLYRLKEGADAGALARQLEQNYRDVGMDANDAQAEVLRELESFRNIMSAMKLFLGLGLIVGVLSLGIITSRSVLERRQEIGMLRALGYRPGQIRAMFFVEVSYTLLLGAVAGVACSIIVTYGLWFAIIRELQYPYVIPWGELGLLVGIAYVVALIATAAPIRRSAKVQPAEALRYLE